MIRRSLTLGLACAALAASAALVASGARAAGSAPAIAAFDEAFSRVSDYTATVTAHESNGKATQQRVYQYAFLKPHYERIDILSGDGAGGGGVWTGGDQVSGHQGGILSHFHLKIGLHDGRAVSLLGYTFPDGLIQNEIDKFKTTPGQLTQRAGPAINGQATDEIDLVPANPSQNAGIVKWVLYLSKSTHWPVRQIGYGPNNSVMIDQTYNQIKTNTGLKESDFPF